MKGNNIWTYLLRLPIRKSWPQPNADHGGRWPNNLPRGLWNTNSRSTHGQTTTQQHSIDNGSKIHDHRYQRFLLNDANGSARILSNEIRIVSARNHRPVRTTQQSQQKGIRILRSKPRNVRTAAGRKTSTGSTIQVTQQSWILPKQNNTGILETWMETN